jgi:hypothetical protein
MGDFKELFQAQGKSHRVGVFLVRFSKTKQFHTGFLIQLKDELPTQLHLNGHHDLRREQFSQKERYFWSELGFAPDEFNQTMLIGRLMAFLKNAKSIPFGISYDGMVFDKAGKFIPGPLGMGLTCATFVLAVCRNLGHPILDEANWPVGDPLDIAWHAYILESFQKNMPLNAEHFAAATQSIGCKRFRPAQVAAGATADGSLTPLNHQDATVAARKIVKKTFGKDAAKIC